MKKRITIVFLIIIVLFTIIIFKDYNDKYSLYKDYADNMLNTSVYNTSDSLIEMDAIINKVINKGYVVESELANLKDLYGVYIENFIVYDNLSKHLRDFDFHEIDNIHVLNFEYTNFFSRIDDLFENKNYHLSSEKYNLDEEQLDLFKRSYDYTSSVTTIIKKNIAYYNSFDIEIMEEETEQGIKISIIKNYKEEYLKPWTDNTSGSEAKESSDGSISSTDILKYDYPEKPYLSAADNSWYNIIKECKLLNIQNK